MKTLPILIVEDDHDLREALCDTLALAGYEAIAVESGPAALDVLQRRRVGLVVTDVQLQPMDGHALLREIRLNHPQVPVLLMTAYGMIDKAVEAMRAGACNYLTKPFEPDSLLAEVVRYMLPAPAEEGGEMIAQDPHSTELLALAQRVAATSATVLITGESGTGKEVVARFIHNHSARAAMPFVAINCAAIPESLLESELFGYTRGAFTGAVQSRLGRIQAAHTGTLFLDEIGDLPLGLQSKLLRFLERGELQRLGSSDHCQVDVRVVAATNAQLLDRVLNGQFREDLYFRLSVFPIELPPLSERKSDIRELASCFLQELGGTLLKLSAPAIAALESHSWPGNIRELKHVMERAVILANGQSVIGEQHLHLGALKAKRSENS